MFDSYRLQHVCVPLLTLQILSSWPDIPTLRLMAYAWLCLYINNLYLDSQALSWTWFPIQHSWKLPRVTSLLSSKLWVVSSSTRDSLLVWYSPPKFNLVQVILSRLYIWGCTGYVLSQLLPFPLPESVHHQSSLGAWFTRFQACIHSSQPWILSFHLYVLPDWSRSLGNASISLYLHCWVTDIPCSYHKAWLLISNLKRALESQRTKGTAMEGLRLYLIIENNVYISAMEGLRLREKSAPL